MFKDDPLEPGDSIRYVKALMKGAPVVRFHQWRTVQRNTVGQHSHGVAMLVCLIHRLAAEWRATNNGGVWGLRMDCMMYAALTHDMAEYIVGDVPAPTKRELGIREILSAHEDKVLKKLGMYVELTDDEQAVVSAADALDGIMFCISEYTLGNRTLASIPRAYEGYLDQLLEVMSEDYAYGVSLIRRDLAAMMTEYSKYES
jgi:5'-deoxynucleotidase YfbR-like HD superfamily hydrolase